MRVLRHRRRLAALLAVLTVVVVGGYVAVVYYLPGPPTLFNASLDVAARGSFLITSPPPSTTIPYVNLSLRLADPTTLDPSRVSFRVDGPIPYAYWNGTHLSSVSLPYDTGGFPHWIAVIPPGPSLPYGGTWTGFTLSIHDPGGCSVGGAEPGWTGSSAPGCGSITDGATLTLTLPSFSSARGFELTMVYAGSDGTAIAAF